MLRATLVALPALARNARFIRASTYGPNNAGNLPVNFNIAGPGENDLQGLPDWQPR
jgi:hypothetical protein